MGKQTKAIIKLDTKIIIKELNKALADEFLAAYQYWIGAKVVKGFLREAVQKELEEHAKEEYAHAEKIVNRIIQLNGTPILDPKDLYKLTTCGFTAPKSPNSLTILQQNIEGERCAIKVYNSLLEKLDQKDIITYNLIIGILEEEIEHECDLEAIAEDIKSCKSSCK